MPGTSFRIEPFTPAMAEEVAPLTFPEFRRLLTDTAPVHGVVARAADGMAVGLAFGMEGPDGRWELASLYVLPLFRRRGLGRRLATALEQVLSGRGYGHGVHFCTVDADDQGYAHFLQAAGWSSPRLRQVMCYSDLDRAERTPWLIRARLPEGHEIRPWHELDAAGREEIAALSISSDVDPLLHEPNCLAETSLVMLRGGQPVGWLITHALGPDLLRWSCSFVREDVQHAGRIFPLWLETVRRQRSETAMTRFVWTVPVSQPRMAKFAVRRMRPWLSRLAYACVSEKRAGADAP